MKTSSFLAFCAIIVGLTAVSCQKDPVNPSSSRSSLGVKIQATNKSFSILKSTMASTPSFVWDSSYIIVSKIEFEAEKRESEMSTGASEIHIEWTGPKKVDLFSLNSLIGNITLQPGIYDEISLKVKASQSDAGSSPDFYLSGTYTNSTGTAIPIVLMVNEDFEFRVKQEGTIVDTVSDYTSLINMNLSLLLSNISAADLDGAMLTGGKIMISSTSNTSLYDKIVPGLTTCEDSHLSKGKGSESGDNHGSDSGDHSGSGSGDGNGSGSGSDNGSGSGPYY